jgi:hypothetical protein
MQETQTTLADFIERHGITGRALIATDNPNMANDQWARTASHWRVVLRCGGRRWTVPFSQGSAHTEPPTVADVLDCVASDIAGYRNARDVRDFASEYGYDDHGLAQRTFELIARQDKRLTTLLGDDTAVETLLWNTERL